MPFIINNIQSDLKLMIHFKVNILRNNEYRDLKIDTIAWNDIEFCRKYDFSDNPLNIVRRVKGL